MSTANLWSFILKLSNSDISNNLQLFHLKKTLIFLSTGVRCYIFFNSKCRIHWSHTFRHQWMGNYDSGNWNGSTNISARAQRKSSFCPSGGKDGWVFSGIGSAQIDDDKDIYSGGVVFMYDFTNVIMFIPHPHNTKSRTKEWVAIYRGIY